MPRTSAFSLLAFSFGVLGCGLLGPSGECEPGRSRPCSCPGVERNGRQSCGPDGLYADCECPSPPPPPEPLEAVEHPPEEEVRVALVSTLAAVKAACALAEDEGRLPELERWFLPSVGERSRRAACRIDDQGLEVYRHSCERGGPLCSEAAEVSVPGVGGTCWQFRADPEMGPSRVVGCRTDEGFRIALHEGLESLRAPPPPEPEDGSAPTG